MGMECVHWNVKEYIVAHTVMYQYGEGVRYNSLTGTNTICSNMLII